MSYEIQLYEELSEVRAPDGCDTWGARHGSRWTDHETKTYYKTIAEVHQMGNANPDKKIRVGGDVAPNSIVREGREVRFTLAQDNLKLHGGV